MEGSAMPGSRRGGRQPAAGPRRPAQREEGPFHASFRLGRVAGIDIGANWSWLVVVGLIVWSLGAVEFPDQVPGLSDGAYAAMAVAATALFFASLLLHELGHAVVARREDMQIAGITLWLFGGVARFEGMFPSARAELRIALAGPAVTLVLTGAFLAAAQLPLSDAVDEVITWLWRINLVLLVFNMLPALPLDGGRVLRALLWRSTGDFTRATTTAGALGRVFGNALIGLGVLLLLFAASPGGLWLIVLGFFLSAAAQAEASLATTRSALAGLRVRDAMIPEPETIAPDLTVAEFLDGPFARTRHAAYPVVRNGAVGLLSYRDAALVRPDLRDRTRVEELAVPAAEALVLAPDDELGDATLELSQTRLRRALVLDETRLVGLLSMTDVSRLLEVRHPPSQRQS
jgi:Zn-dependent protease/CBS domain-containing protein